MIYDQNLNIISKAGPELSTLQKAYQTTNKSDYQEWPWFVHPSSLGTLPYSVLRDLYKLSPAIRPAVDSITREVSTLPWKVIHKDYKYHSTSELNDIIDFLDHPNLDREDLAIVLSKFIHDLLVVGKGVIEKVRNPYGDIIELVARDAILFAPKTNSYGFIINYVEYKRDTYTPAHSHRKENIIFRYFTPTTYTFSSIPIIETIINEVAVLMLSVQAIGWSLTRDEIPPGILHLGNIGEVALERAKASFEATKGILNQSKIRVVDNVDAVNWVQFTRPFREIQLAELMPMIERIVARNFGLSPVESSLADVARGVAEMSFRSSQSKLIKPMMTMVAGAINKEIVEDFNKKAMFIFSSVPQESMGERSRAYGEMVDRGLITDNEARVNLGFDPVPGGALDVQQRR